MKTLDVYKKIPILRTLADTVVDEHGAHQAITLADLETRDEVVAPVKQAKRLNIPIPLGRTVADYEAKSTVCGYQPPVSYIRHVKKAEEATLDYVLEKKDKAWLAKRGALKLLDEAKLELAIDVLEKATYEACGSAVPAEGVLPVTQDAAEALLAARLSMPSTSASREVVADVYEYWLTKRTARGHSLLRRFVPPTAPDDTNPHHVFRPREKERYKLRRSRKNDMESFRKMQQLRRELGRVRVLLGLVHHREKVKKLAVAVSEEAFAQQLHDCAVPEEKGAPTPKRAWDAQELAGALALPQATGDYDPKKKKKRLAVEEAVVGVEASGESLADTGVIPPPPQPSFMEPLDTRGSAFYPVLDPWGGFEARPGRPPQASHEVFDGCPPPPVSTDSVAFACRARIGRGGRVVFDRTPLLAAPRHLMVGVPLVGKAVGASALPRGVRRRTDRFDPRRLQRIYQASDSEDEEVVAADKALTLSANTTLKYEIGI